MPGSGKSTVGVLLAKALGYDFLDTDLVIQSREGQLLQTLVDRHGVEGFLDLEQAAVLSVSCSGCVISPGGSVVLREAMIAHLKSLGPLIYLSVPLPVLLSRVSNLSTRGIAKEPQEDLAHIMQHRAPLYQRYADLSIPVEGHHSPEDMVALVQEQLSNFS